MSRGQRQQCRYKTVPSLFPQINRYIHITLNIFSREHNEEKSRRTGSKHLLHLQKNANNAPVTRAILKGIGSFDPPGGSLCEVSLSGIE